MNSAVCSGLRRDITERYIIGGHQDWLADWPQKRLLEKLFRSQTVIESCPGSHPGVRHAVCPMKKNEEEEEEDVSGDGQDSGEGQARTGQARPGLAISGAGCRAADQ
ncbi:unnamed protein product [Calypogeia fissa]